MNDPAAAAPPPHAPAGHPSVAHGRVGVLLVNLGTPDGTDYRSMRRYLGQFLSDRRVIEMSPLLWQPILQGPILTFRPGKSGRAYAKVWRKETNESPLRYFTRLQAAALQPRLGDAVLVDWAMRYGKPSIADRLDAMKAAGCDRIVVFALYPQYSATTTATVYDDTFRALMGMRWQPAIRTVPAYHDDPAYIRALAGSVRAHLATLDFEPEVILASFHGLPKEYFDKGDPYHCHCLKAARLLREELGLAPDRLRATFQSRFGPAEWLQPYTDKTLEALPGEGVTKAAVIMPGFVSDCLETLEEIAMEGAETFLKAGGAHYTTIPCLNDSPGGIDVIEAVVRRELSGWVAG